MWVQVPPSVPIYFVMKQWKSKISGRTVTVLGDEIQNGKLYRYFIFDDSEKQVINMWLLNDDKVATWESHFEPII